MQGLRSQSAGGQGCFGGGQADHNPGTEDSEWGVTSEKEAGVGSSSLGRAMGNEAWGGVPSLLSSAGGCLRAAPACRAPLRPGQALE